MCRSFSKCLWVENRRVWIISCRRCNYTRFFYSAIYVCF
ncbi:zinc ribbon domain-containing protein [Vibrio coralliirubri]